jgi:SAM-dependent methyltransferase
MMTAIPDDTNIRAYFQERLDTYGNTPRGADWNSSQAQITRFAQLLKICDFSAPFSILDYGSGYGALASYLEDMAAHFTYTGFDILEDMVKKGQELHAGKFNITFTADAASLPAVDYVVASGIFNIRLETSYEAWTAYVTETLQTFDRLSRKGFASNFLTRYSDAEYMRPHLYYADPSELFDYCKQHFSRNVALLHDYDLYDFTILVRKSA